MRGIYTFLFAVLLPFAFFRLWRRGSKLPAYRQRWRERLGYTTKLDTTKTTIWFHTVSVGEFIAARPLIQHYLNQENTQILITSTTPTGSERVRASFGDQVAHSYLPYDIPCSLNRFLNATNPSKFVCLETELWPNLIHCCVKRGIKIVLANARLSEKSARGYAHFSSLTKNMLQGLSAAAIQNQEDADRFIALGLDSDRAFSIGNIKFDLELSSELISQAQLLKDRLRSGIDDTIWIAASTHKGEDEIILSAYAKIKTKYPNLKLILVPRHPERFETVFQLCLTSGYHTVRRSQTENTESFDIMLGDTMGELMLLFGASDVAFVGGSLVENGGHNYIEPAAWGLPLISGPSTFNFRETAKELIAESALAIAENDQAIAIEIERLLKHPDEMNYAGEQAQAVANRNRGALARLIEIIDSV